MGALTQGLTVHSIRPISVAGVTGLTIGFGFDRRSILSNLSYLSTKRPQVSYHRDTYVIYEYHYYYIIRHIAVNYIIKLHDSMSTTH